MAGVSLAAAATVKVTQALTRPPVKKRLIGDRAMAAALTIWATAAAVRWLLDALLLLPPPRGASVCRRGADSSLPY